jgi:transcriptional regulator with XRE-family HTH domain
MDKIEVGKKLRKLRKSKGLSISALAEECDLSAGLISQIERNLTAPSVVSLYRIAQALGVNINYFFTSDSPGYNINSSSSIRNDNSPEIT